jgi:uncharacterized protein (TIGR03086 family)
VAAELVNRAQARWPSVSTMDPLAGLRLATEEFDRHAAAVAVDQWALPTPCAEWTARDLVEHVTGGNRFAVALLDGASTAEAFERVMAPGFSDDVLGELRRSAAAQLDAFAANGAFTRICQHPRGEVTGAEFAGYRLGDLTVHAWDLARARGGDERLDERLVATTWAAYQQDARSLAASGTFGTGRSGAVGEDAPLQERLLDLVGRRP